MATDRAPSDDAVRTATGRTWDEWVKVLDARGAAGLSHRQIAALLEESGEIESGWWIQMVTVGYEKRKGQRVTGETADTGFQIGLQRTLPLAPDEAWTLVTSAEGVRAWLGGEPKMRWQKGERYALQDGTTGEVRVFKPGSHLRMTWQPEGWPRPSTIQVRVVPASGGRSVLSFHQEHLPGPAEREARRAFFEAAADALQQQIADGGHRAKT
ncbi:MAG TPA: SRPBCC domain-containing protein [Longimicrobium sp.]|nr:SRPBCC domain-containing protein [Longimicrobium sp.]